MGDNLTGEGGEGKKRPCLEENRPRPVFHQLGAGVGQAEKAGGHSMHLGGCMECMAGECDERWRVGIVGQ